MQIWLLPNREEVEPGYQQFFPKLQLNNWTLVASQDGQNGSLQMYQDAKVFLGIINPNSALTTTVERYGWLQVIEGSLSMDDISLDHGDGVAIDSPATFTLTAKTAAKVMLFSL